MNNISLHLKDYEENSEKNVFFKNINIVMLNSFNIYLTQPMIE